MKNLFELTIIGLSTSYVQKNTCAIILKEKNGGLRLPIVIGIFEAQAIAIELENIKPSRPLTHDLFFSFSTKLDFEINKIIITDLKEGVFFAKIKCTKTNIDGSKNRFTIDARPSDAIAISLKFDAPLLTTQKVLDLAGLEIEKEIEKEIDDLQEGEDIVSKREKSDKTSPVDIKSMSLSELKSQLKNAVNTENYEFALVLKQEIDKRLG